MFTLLGFIEGKACNMIELLECLPMIEHLTIYGDNASPRRLVLDSVPEELLASLIHRKYFCFKEI
ncbi:hypothetical protein M8C21_029113, partial [Ambrosia artemisiifolia]